MARGAGMEDAWQASSRSTWSPSSTPRSCATPSTRPAARSRTRFDFKGALAEITQEKEALTIHTDSELRAKAIRDLVESKAIRRSLSLKIFDWGAIEPAGGMTVRQRVELRRGSG